MGDNTTFRVNDDGSVTMGRQFSEQEQNIIDIFRIEKSKGGAFASRRMKKRALRYAKSVKYPEFMVDKLMLDNYPDEFGKYPKTTAIIVWFIIGIVFLVGAISFAFIANKEYGYVLSNKEKIQNYEECLHTGDRARYRDLSWDWIGDDLDDNTFVEKVEQKIQYWEDYRDNHLQEMKWWLLAVLACGTISAISVIQIIRNAKAAKS